MPAPASEPEDVPGWAAPQMPPSGGPPVAPTGGMAPPLPPAPPRATSPLRRFRGLIIIVAIVVVVAVVGVVFRDRITGNAGSLQVGDCFDLPADAVAATDATVGDVQHHPCTEAHGGEVFAVLTYPAAATDTYPPTDAFVAFARPAVRVELPVVHGRRPGRLHDAQRRLLLPPRHRVGER